MSAATQFEIHPAADWLPALSPDEYAELKADIEKRGLREPILRRDGFIVIDGRHRLKACEELGIEPRFVEFEGDDIIAEIASRNLFRRHLPARERAELVVKMCGEELSANARERQKFGLRKGDQSPVVSKSTQRGRTWERVASIAKVGQHTARRSLELANAKRLISKKPKPEHKPRRRAKAADYPVGSDRWREIVWSKFAAWIWRFPVTHHNAIRALLHERCAPK
jgi:ParB-like chromosome segregation protein Spo0J